MKHAASIWVSVALSCASIPAMAENVRFAALANQPEAIPCHLEAKNRIVVNIASRRLPHKIEGSVTDASTLSCSEITVARKTFVIVRYEFEVLYYTSGKRIRQRKYDVELVSPDFTLIDTRSESETKAGAFSAIWGTDANDGAPMIRMTYAPQAVELMKLKDLDGMPWFVTIFD